MKKLFFLAALLIPASILLVSCTKKPNQSVEVIKDCTGTYLRYDNKDYQVCNPEKTEALDNGAQVKATYKTLKVCGGSASNVITCKLYHPSEGWIHVLKISKE